MVTKMAANILKITVLSNYSLNELVISSERWKGHVILFECFDWSLVFHCHGNQDGGKHSKNNSFVQL